MDDSTNVLSSVWENGKVIYLKKSTSFGELFEKTVGNDQILLNVEVEYSVSDGKSTNPVIVNLSNDLSVCVDLGIKYVKFGLLRRAIPSCSTSKKNAFTSLRSSAKTMNLPDKISSDDKLMVHQRLYNDVIDVLEEECVKWVASCI
jgi:hypothetical protein